MLSLNQYRYDGSEKIKLEKAPTSARALGLNREQVVEQTQQNKLEIASLQDRLYAEGQEGVVVIFQAMDAAGKNAQELLDDLTIQSNHMRQGAITQELTEISAGALGQRRRQERQTEGGNML